MDIKDIIQKIRESVIGKPLQIDCKGIEIISKAEVDELKALRSEGREFVLDNLNQDCYAALLNEGMEAVAGKHTSIPVIDVTNCTKIGEGSNSLVYQVTGDTLVKVLKKQPDIDTIVWERILNKKAVQAGIPCPISMGLALVNGKLALLAEMLDSISFTKLVRKDSTNIEKYMDQYVRLIKGLHAIKGESLEGFPRMTMYNELLGKADQVDKMLDPKYRGMIRKIVETIDEPEVLTHGDIQPSNIRFGERGVSFIDLEKLASGPAVIDIGSLRRSLFADTEFLERTSNEFLGLSADDCNRIWKAFTDKYYEGDERKEEKILVAKIMAGTLVLAKFVKSGESGDRLKKCVAILQQLLDVWILKYNKENTI